MPKLEITVGKALGGFVCIVDIPDTLEELAKNSRFNCEIENIGKGELEAVFYDSKDISIGNIYLTDKNAVENLKKIAEKTGYKLKKGQTTFGFKLSDDQRDLVRNTIMQNCQSLVLKTIKEEGIKILYEQQFSNYDWPTLALNEWRLIENPTTDFFMSILSDEGIKANTLFEYLKEKGILKEKKRTFTGWSEVELTDYEATINIQQAIEIIEHFSASKKEKGISKIKAEIEKLQAMSMEEFVRSYLIDKIHVTEEGYFSSCDPFCDDCFWWDYFDYKLTPKEILQKAPTFTVRSEKGKIYTYYRPTKELIKELANQEEIKKMKADKIENLKNNYEAIKKEKNSRIEALKNMLLDKTETTQSLETV